MGDDGNHLIIVGVCVYHLRKENIKVKLLRGFTKITKWYMGNGTEGVLSFPSKM
jgi:hypothetical protein